MRIFNEWLLLPQRFAIHEPTATAVLADVHLGYSAARQRQGDAIPGRSVHEEMAALIQAARIHEVRALVVAGDLFERGFDGKLLQSFLELLDGLHIRFVGLVPGNHDRGLPNAPNDMSVFSDGYELSDWRIVHGDQSVDAAKTIMGHWHPAIRCKGRKTPCFLRRGTHLILPAFSTDAAGADVDVEARWHEWERFAISGERVAAIKRKALR